MFSKTTTLLLALAALSKLAVAATPACLLAAVKYVHKHPAGFFPILSIFLVIVLGMVIHGLT